MFLLDLLAPPECAACRVRVRARRAFCPDCATTIVRDEHPAAAFAYGGALAAAITRWKFEGALGVGTALTRLFAAELAPRVPPDSILIPVPLHPRRLAERGFNPAQLLASALARATQSKVDPTLLRRSRDTPQQSLQGRAARLVNLAGAFVRSRDVPAGNLVLVDDVLTTGSTLAACKVALGVTTGAAVLARVSEDGKVRSAVQWM